MPKPLRCGFASVVAATVALALQHACVQAQGLFNNQAAGGRTQTSATSTTGSLFSGNVGVQRSANAAASRRAGGSFVGRSNQGFVGGGTGSQSSTDGERSNTARGAEPARRLVRPATDGQAEASSAGGRRGTDGGRGRPTKIVPRQRIAFPFVPRDATAISAELEKQLANLAARNADFAQVRVSVDAAGRVELRGQVPSENTRKLAALLIRLEPGVRAVHNELSVKSSGGFQPPTK